MAVLRQIHCLKCNKAKMCGMGAGEYRTICHECQHEEDEKKEAEYFSSLGALSMEERIRKIEKWIYDYRPYSGPTRF